MLHRIMSDVCSPVRPLWRGLGLALNADRTAAALIIGLQLLNGLLPAAQVLLLQRAVDQLTHEQALADWPAIMLLAGLYVVTLTLATILEPPTRALQARLEERAVADLDRHLLQAAGHLCDLGRIERPSFGDTLRITRMAIFQIPRLPNLMIERGLAALVPLLGVLALLGSLHPLIPVMLLGVALPHLVIGTHVEWRAWQTMADSSHVARQADYTLRMATEPILARELRIFGLEQFVVERFRLQSRAAIAEVGRERIHGIHNTALFGLLHALVLAGGFWYIATQVGAGLLTLGALALYLAAIQQAETQLHRLAIWGTLVGQAWREVRDVLAFLDSAAPIIAISPNGATIPAGPPAINLADLHFRYPESTSPVLEHLQLELPTGKITALVGLNGAGKSTLVKLLTRLYDPQGGMITLQGSTLASYDLEALRRATAVVYQDFAHFSISAGDNILVGSAAGEGRSLAEALAWSGADQVIARLPNGLETMLTRRFDGGAELSGGEWQKIALARAFVRQAALIILDEPAAALDAEAEVALFERFRSLLSGTTGLIISHRMASVRLADQIIVLEAGHIIEAGSHTELIRLGGRYAQLFNMQAARYQ